MQQRKWDSAILMQWDITRRMEQNGRKNQFKCNTINNFIIVRSVRSWNSFRRVVDKSSQLRDLNSSWIEKYKNTVVSKCTITI